jgi:hypothetical protein
LEALLKVLASFEPTLVMAVMAATAIRAAIRPYSMAVAPRSLRFDHVSAPDLRLEGLLLRS